MSAKPILPVIALDLFDEAMLFEIWARMLSTLKSCFDVIVVKEKGEAQALLNNPSVKIAVANDTDTVAVHMCSNQIPRTWGHRDICSNVSELHAHGRLLQVLPGSGVAVEEW